MTRRMPWTSTTATLPHLQKVFLYLFKLFPEKVHLKVNCYLVMEFTEKVLYQVKNYQYKKDMKVQYPVADYLYKQITQKAPHHRPSTTQGRHSQIHRAACR